MDEQIPIFVDSGLPPPLIDDLRRFNPWWENEAMPVQPATRRHLVTQTRRCLNSNVAPVVVVRGPRQVGKTTAQFQIIQDLLDEGVHPRCILRVQFDDLETLARLKEPILRITDWFERRIAPRRFNALAQSGKMAYLFLDEIQNLKGWDVQLKSLVDNSTVKAVVTGSSALRIELGRDSLAGRINTLETGVLSLTEIGALRNLDTPAPFLSENGLDVLLTKEFWTDLREHGLAHREFRQHVFRHFAERGGYPIVHREKDVAFVELTDHLNETVIKRVVQHDLRIGERGRKRDAHLLEELFRLVCRYAGQTPTATMLAAETRMVLGANVATQRVHSYLKFLGDSLLVHLVPPLEIRLKRRRGSPKLCLADHGLRASWLQEHIPLVPEELARRPHLTALAGHLAESIFGALVSTIRGLDVAHYPPRGMDQEVDFILTLGEKRIPVEVKYQKRIDPLRDTLGLRSFLEKAVNNAPFGLLITQEDAAALDDPRIVRLPLSTIMMLR